jgi:geranylgeranyl diphosphate synthase, type II
MPLFEDALILFEDQLKRYLESLGQPKTLYEPMAYTLSLGGKRSRPGLLLVALGHYEKELKEGIAAALAIEIFHNFTLVHDDIMDQASLRRGKETTHILYGTDAAILTGDVMLIKAYELLSTYPDPIAIQLIKCFNKMAKELCEGQRLDMDFEKSDNVTISDYIEMITLKTSVLLGVTMQMAAIIAGKSINEQNAVYEFGKNIGIAFQIQDDILDTYGEAAAVGKKKGGDIAQNKKTFLYLKALELSMGEEKASLLAFYNRENSIAEEIKIKEITKIFNSLVVKEYATQVMDAYKDLSISHLKNSGLSSAGEIELSSYADYLIKRSH